MAQEPPVCVYRTRPAGPVLVTAFNLVKTFFARRINDHVHRSVSLHAS